MMDEKENWFSGQKVNYEIQGFGILFQVLMALSSRGRRVGSGRGGGAGKGILPVSRG